MTKRPRFVLGNREALELAIEEARRVADTEGGDVYVCHGPPRCLTNHGEPDADGGPADCPFCHRVPLGDPRSSRDIVLDMEREQ